MNNTSVKRAVGGKKSDEPQSELQKIFQKILENFHHVEKCVEFTKEILTDCGSRLEDLRPQMIALESAIQERSADSQIQTTDANKSVEERNRLKKNSVQEIIEEITIEGSEKPIVSSNMWKCGAGSENRRKRQRIDTIEEEISIITQKTDDENSPGPSGETLKNTKSSREFESEDPLDQAIGTANVKDIVERAFQKTKGVLSAKELKIFINLFENVADPVQLAKVSFTTDIERLYFQLMTFHFHLKVGNDATAMVDGKFECYENRVLEHKVKRLIQVLKADLKLSPITEIFCSPETPH